MGRMKLLENAILIISSIKQHPNMLFSASAAYLTTFSLRSLRLGAVPDQASGLPRRPNGNWISAGLDRVGGVVLSSSTRFGMANAGYGTS
jgi:hypothetical protein